MVTKASSSTVKPAPPTFKSGVWVYFGSLLNHKKFSWSLFPKGKIYQVTCTLVVKSSFRTVMFSNFVPHVHNKIIIVQIFVFKCFIAQKIWGDMPRLLAWKWIVKHCAEELWFMCISTSKQFNWNNLNSNCNRKNWNRTMKLQTIPSPSSCTFFLAVVSQFWELKQK